MDRYVKQNITLNLLGKYGIKQNHFNVEELKKEIEEKDYYVYLKICDLVNSARIIEATNT